MHDIRLTRTRSIFISTALVIALAGAIGSLGAHVVTTMRSSTDAIDDHRAVQAAQTALSGLKQHLTGTVRDNAVWDEAYEATQGADLQAWIYRNWGRTSADYPLYDGAIVTDEDGGVVASYWKGEASDPFERVGGAVVDQIRTARASSEPVTNFFPAGKEVVIVGSQAIRPFTAPDKDGDHYILSFVKSMSPAIVTAISEEHQLEHLRLQNNPEPRLLQYPLLNMTGAAVAFLVWPSDAPGTHVFDDVYPYIFAAAILLVVFLVTVLAIGGAEAGRLRQLAEHSLRQATHDSLTGLLNRFGLLSKLARLLPLKGARQPLTLHLLDLDGFKPVNDAWGHAIGDELLRLVAKSLHECHPEGVAAARIGGDEFAIVQVGTSDPELVARAILDVFSEPFVIDGRTIEIGGSIGIATEQDLTDSHELVRRADMALYRAKDTGRRRFVTFESQLEDDRLKAATLEAELQQALQDGKIDVMFQPLVSSHSGMIAGVEALARWNSVAGPVRPDIFIPIAEKSGLIDNLGRQILHKAIKGAEAWPDLSLSVNVSPIQLCNPSFAAEVLEVLQERGFAPARLTLEITEGVLMSNPDQAKRSIDSLRAEGIRFALDDFGCGYASIGALREFGFDRMKIDRSLVTAADGDAAGLGVLKATISLASALNIPVTAEGIETGRQAEMLRDAGCDQLQGYLLGKPMTAAELSATLRPEAA